MGSKKKKQKIGYAYFMGLVLIPCSNHNVKKIHWMQAGERDLGVPPVTGNGRHFIDKETLFGGDEGEGGFKGWIDVCFGGATQGLNHYLKQFMDKQSAHRNVVSVVFNKCLVTMLSKYVKAVRFGIEAQPDSWYPDKCAVGPHGSTNVAHIIYDVLTSQREDAGLGLHKDMINDAKFRTVADMLHAEGFGVSIKRSKAMNCKEFIADLMSTVNGICYEHPTTGQFELKLFRGGYDVDKLPVFNDSNSEMVEFQRPQPAEMTNRVTVRYNPLATGKEQAVTVGNLAAINRLGVIPEVIDFPAIDRHDDAARMANTLLQQKSTPCAKVKLKVLKSYAMTLAYGDEVVCMFPNQRVAKMVCRVLKVDIPDITKGYAYLTLAEDIFNLSDNVMVGTQPDEWVDPVKPPVFNALGHVIEAPYPVLAKYMPSELLELLPDEGYPLEFIGDNLTVSITNHFYRKQGLTWEESDRVSKCPNALNHGVVDRVVKTIILKGLRNDLSTVPKDSLIVFGSELMSFENVEFDAAGDATITVKRGVADTVPVEHPDGERMFFLSVFEVDEGYTFSDGEVSIYRACPQTGVGVLPIDQSSDILTTYTGRQHRPFGAANLMFNAEYWPIVLYGVVRLTWAHRNRVQQSDILVDWYTGSVTPEPNIMYKISFVENGVVVTQFETSETVYEWSPPPRSDPPTPREFTCKIEAFRDGVACLQAVSHSFSYYMAPTNGGFDKGFDISFDGV